MEIFIKQKLHKLTHPIAFTMIFILLALGGLVFGQTKSSKEKECKDKENAEKKADKVEKEKPAVKWVERATAPRVANAPKVNRNRFRFRTFSVGGEYVDERSIAVHPKVYVSLCVLKGSIKVNGWDRDEARVFVRNSKKTKIGFKVREKDRKQNLPVWIQVSEYNPNAEAESVENTCLSGEIELDIPQNASITIENSKDESETTIDSVRAAKVEVLRGDIYLSNIADRIDAQTYQGGVTVRNSSGKMFLSTTTGNIVAYNTDSSEIGDYFKAKTRSGAITLQSVEQKEVESSSTTGSINYIGNLKPFGKYDFYTTNGSINLAIPSDSSCQIIAAYGGAFQSELPLKEISKEKTESLFYFKGKMGKGEANLNLRSFNGTISIRERKESVLAGF